MARTKQYVVYTREFSKGRVNNKVGVFLDEAKNALDNTGNINGGVIKFSNLKMKPSFIYFDQLKPFIKKSYNP